MASNVSPPLSSPHHHFHTIFVDTNIDTHLALIVSLHDTISDVKGKIRTEHALCFQDVGEIAIQAIKVRRRGFFYNLTDSMYVMNAFDGVKGSWFLCIDAVPICPVKFQQKPANKDIPEHLVHGDYAIPVCSGNMHKEIVFCGSLPKSQDTVKNKLLVGELNTVKYDSQKALDSLKELLVEVDQLQNGNISPAQSLHVCSTDLLISDDRNRKALNGVKVDAAHLLKDAAVSQCEPEKNAGPYGKRNHTIDHCNSSENLINQEDGGRKNDHNYLGIDSGEDIRSSTQIHRRKSKKRAKKIKDGLHEEHLEDCRKSKLSRSEGTDKSNKSVILPQEEIVDTSSERLPCTLPLENNISLQNNPVEKHKKKRKRKSSKLYEKDHLAMPYEIPVTRSSQVSADPHSSGKEGTNALISLGKSHTKLTTGAQLPNDGNISMSLDTERSFEVVNEREIAEVQTLIDNPKDRRKKHGNLDEGTSHDFSIKDPAKPRNSPRVEFPSMVSCSTGNFRNQSTKVLACKGKNDHQNPESDAVKCIRELNFRENETGPVSAKAGICSSSEKFLYHEQASNLLSKDSSSGKHKVLDKETDTAANPEVANRDMTSAQIGSKLRRSRRNSKSELARAFDSTELHVTVDHFNSNGAQVSLNDVQDDSTIFIKQADQKVNGGHKLDTINALSSSYKKLPNQDQVPHNLDKHSSASVNTDSAINAPLQAAPEVQEKQRRSRKKSKKELSKLRPPGINDGVLLKLNGEVTETDEGRVSNPSKLDNASKQKKEQICVDAKVSLPLSHEDFSTHVNIHQDNPLDSSYAKQHADLASPKSKPDGNKSNKEELEARVFKNEELEARNSSEKSDRLDVNKPDNSNINFVDYFVPKEGNHCPNVHSTVLPSKKSETRRKHKTGRKTDMNQPNDSPTNLLQSPSHKHHKVASQTNDNNSSDCNMVDASQDAATKDSTKDCNPEKAQKSKKMKKSSKQESSFPRTESDLSLHKAHEDQKCEKDLQDNVNKLLAQLSKSGYIESEQEKKIIADANKNGLELDHCIDHHSPSGSMSNKELSNDSTEDTPDKNRRYRVVRKNPTRRSKEIVSNPSPELLLDTSGRIFSDVSGASSDSESGSYERKAAISADLSPSGDSGSQLEEMQEEANALELQTATSFSELEKSDEIDKNANGKIEDRSRSSASSHKIPLSAIFKSSSSYKKAKLVASQSEFVDALDVVPDTQPEHET